MTSTDRQILLANLMAQAPSNVPDWFVHEKPPVPKLEISTDGLPHRELVQQWVDHEAVNVILFRSGKDLFSYMSMAYEEQDGQKLKLDDSAQKALDDFRSKVAKALSPVSSDWNKQNAEARYFQWLRYFAEQVLNHAEQAD